MQHSGGSDDQQEADKVFFEAEEEEEDEEDFHDDGSARDVDECEGRGEQRPREKSRMLKGLQMRHSQVVASAIKRRTA